MIEGTTTNAFCFHSFERFPFYLIYITTGTCIYRYFLAFSVRPVGAALVHVLDAAIFYNFYLVGARASHSSPLLVPLVPTGTPTNTPVPGTA